MQSAKNHPINAINITIGVYGLRKYNPPIPIPPYKGMGLMGFGGATGHGTCKNLQVPLLGGRWAIRKILQIGDDMPWSNESRQSRGYGAEWEKVRVRVIERAKGMCEVCAKQGRVAQGRDVDHVVSKARAKVLGWSQKKVDNLQNLQLLCHLCHRKKTANENGRTYHEPRPAIGVDGWPIE